PSTAMNLEWEAADPNEDSLIYTLEYQPDGSDRWLLIDDDLTQSPYEWQTRRAPDGRYLLRVTASDRPGNPGDMAKTTSRLSDPVLVDNGRPRLEDVEYELDGRNVTIRGVAADELSRVRSVAYYLDAAEEAIPV